MTGAPVMRARMRGLGVRRVGTDQGLRGAGRIDSVLKRILDIPEGERGAVIAGPSSKRDARRESRLLVQSIDCNRGRVLDISSRGMRVISRTRWKEGEMLPVTLRSGAMRVTTPARCVWARREGWFSWVIGVAFEHATDEQRRRVGDIASAHTQRAAA